VGGGQCDVSSGGTNTVESVLAKVDVGIRGRLLVRGVSKIPASGVGELDGVFGGVNIQDVPNSGIFTETDDTGGGRRTVVPVVGADSVDHEERTVPGCAQRILSLRL
jgi:hypothetical protein